MESQEPRLLKKLLLYFTEIFENYSETLFHFRHSTFYTISIFHFQPAVENLNNTFYRTVKPLQSIHKFRNHIGSELVIVSEKTGFINSINGLYKTNSYQSTIPIQQTAVRINFEALSFRTFTHQFAI